MIPKIIHQIWVGKKQISDINYKYVREWIEICSKHINAQHYFWDNESVKNNIELPPEKQAYIDSDKYPIALKADILRYEIINKYGGIYVDVDMEALKPLDEFMFNCKFLGGIQNNGQVNIGIFGAEVGCPLIVEVCSGIINNIETMIKNGKPLYRVDQLTGPCYFDRICKKYMNVNGYMFYPPEFFYPYWFTEKHRRYENFRVTCPKAYTAHHWGGEWV